MINKPSQDAQIIGETEYSRASDVQFKQPKEDDRELWRKEVENAGNKER